MISNCIVISLHRFRIKYERGPPLLGCDGPAVAAGAGFQVVCGSEYR